MNIPFAKRPRPIADPNSVEAGLRDLMSSLRKQNDKDCAAILAGATNIFYSALLTFRGNTALHADDVLDLLEIWEILLNTGRSRVQTVSEFAPKGKIEEPESEDRRV